MTDVQHIYFLCCLFATDIIAIRIARKLLRDFLRSKKNKQKEYKIYSTQSLSNKITLNYIFSMLKHNKKAFEKYHKLYKISLYTEIPQYLIVVLLYCLIGELAIFSLFFFISKNIIIYIIIRANFDANMVSIYRHKP